MFPGSSREAAGSPAGAVLGAGPASPPRGIGPSDQRAVCNARPRRSEGADQMSNDKRWQDMTPDEQEVAIRQISGAVNGLQFRVQDLEDAVKALQERLDKRGD